MHCRQTILTNSTTLSHLGIHRPNKVLTTTRIERSDSTAGYTATRGDKLFELSNHLGNVLATVSDYKLPTHYPITTTTDPYNTFELKINSLSHYSPFGVELDRRSWTDKNYRYSFNSMEKDDEVKGGGNHIDFGARAYDSRLAKFLSLDRFTSKFIDMSPYSYSSNSPIFSMDINGDSTYIVIYGKGWYRPSYKGKDYDNGDLFQKQAEARKREIESRDTFDPSRDKVVLKEAATENEFLDIVNQEYSTGPTAEMHIYSHGSPYSLNLGGRQDASDPDSEVYRCLSVKWAQGQYASPLNGATSNTDGSGEIRNIDPTNFEAKAKVFLWGCNMGSLGQMSPGQELATRLGRQVRVYAFNSFSQHKTEDKKMGSPRLIIDGEMIRDKDFNTNEVKLTQFKPLNAYYSPSKKYLK